MALTYLNSQMIEIPAHIDSLSTTSLSVGSFNGTNSNINNLTATEINVLELNVQDINFPSTGGNIYNDTNVYGNLTINGSITALSGLEFIETTVSTTTALSVVNTGSGPALFVNQQAPSLESIAVFAGTDIPVLKINNTSPDEYQPGVDIHFPNNGPALKVSNTTNSNVFVVTSGDRVGINTSAPVSELEVQGKITATSLSAPDLISQNIITNNITTDSISAAVFNIDNLQAQNTITENSFSVNSYYSYLTSDNSFLNNLTADKITTNNLHALSATIDVLDITLYELSGFQINGDLTVTDSINVSSIFVDLGGKIVSPLFEGNVNGDVIGNLSGSFTGNVNVSGFFDGSVKIDPAISLVPLLSTTIGNPGQLTFDEDYLYVCVATDTWKRVALSGWEG